jgi:hypothetical protein
MTTPLMTVAFTKYQQHSPIDTATNAEGDHTTITTPPAAAITTITTTASIRIGAVERAVEEEEEEGNRM